MISTASNVDGKCEYSLLNKQVPDSRRGVVFQHRVLVEMRAS